LTSRKPFSKRFFLRAFKSFLLRFLCVRCPSLVKDRPPTAEEATEKWFHDADLLLMWLDDGGLERHIKDKPMTCLTLFTRFRDDLREIADGAFLPGHKRFVATLKGTLKHDPEFELVRLRDGNTVRRRALV
jgi:hypothetical protein